MLVLSGVLVVGVGCVVEVENVGGYELFFFSFGIVNSFLLASRFSAVFFFDLTY